MRTLLQLGRRYGWFYHGALGAQSLGRLLDVIISDSLTAHEAVTDDRWSTRFAGVRRVRSRRENSGAKILESGRFLVGLHDGIDALVALFVAAAIVKERRTVRTTNYG